MEKYFSMPFLGIFQLWMGGNHHTQNLRVTLPFKTSISVWKSDDDEYEFFNGYNKTQFYCKIKVYSHC